MIRESDELFGKTIEQAEILDVLFGPLGLGGGNALGTLFALEGALQHEVRARIDDLAITTGLKELAAECAAAQASSTS